MKIDKKIVGYSVRPVQALEKDNIQVVVYDRPDKIDGRTYKISPPPMAHSMYITINNLVLPTGESRPFEIFINTKSVEDYGWITALTRMLSSVFRISGDISFVVEELKQVYGPKDSYWESGKLMPSVVAHIGKIIERHFKWTEKLNENIRT